MSPNWEKHTSNNIKAASFEKNSQNICQMGCLHIDHEYDRFVSAI